MSPDEQFRISFSFFSDLTQSHKMVEHTQTIRWQFADELLECD